ncbi:MULTISPECIES: dipeptidase PepV [Clostridia]|uniref:dipeptidase PepV n=1 Tax=Clostridia TaxID=186801 RepID=UPI000EA0522E|nr:MULTISPECIES: dipeptidase PepV [Clostridia]NBJ69660.1 dipeptidase PepV [Roseburia sp. 1XD42-34]RKI78286.1 dipeptidase PepV [Clostridium sp. 1xD42-85]
MKIWETYFNEEEFIRDLSSLLSIRSIMDTKSSNEKQPFGKNVQEALQFMLQLGEKEGLTTYQNNGYYGYIELGPEEAKNYIAVLCHVDVVPASGTWSYDPFNPKVTNNRIYGRGAIDDKGPTMASWYALKMVIKSKAPLKHKIRLIIGTNEESGMRCMKSYVENEPEALFGFAPDAQFPIIHAEKGQINMQLSCKPKHVYSGVSLVSFNSGERGNMVPDSAIAVVRGLSPTRQLGAFQRMEDQVSINKIDANTYSIKADGVSAHGMEPCKGENAAFTLASLLLSIDGLQFHPYLAFIHTYLKNDFQGENLGIDFEDSITGKLTVNAGVFHYTEDHGGKISLNIRCPVETSYDQTLKQLKALTAQKGWIISNIRLKKPHHVDSEHKGIKALQDAYKGITSNDPILLTTGGATYARFLSHGVAFGAVFPDKENTAHQVDEYAEINDLKRAAFIYAEALVRLANL